MTTVFVNKFDTQDIALDFIFDEGEKLGVVYDDVATTVKGDTRIDYVDTEEGNVRLLVRQNGTVDRVL